MTDDEHGGVGVRGAGEEEARRAIEMGCTRIERFGGQRWEEREKEREGGRMDRTHLRDLHGLGKVDRHRPCRGERGSVCRGERERISVHERERRSVYREYRYRIFLEKHRIFLKTQNHNKKNPKPKP